MDDWHQGMQLRYARKFFAALLLHRVTLQSLSCLWYAAMFLESLVHS